MSNEKKKVDRRTFLKGLAVGLVVGAGVAGAVAAGMRPSPITITTTSTVPGPTVTETTTAVKTMTAVKTTTKLKTTTVPGPTVTETVTTTVTPAPPKPKPQANGFLYIDYRLCTGCMLCALACSERNIKRYAPDLAKDTINIEFAVIRPMRFQYVDIPVVCGQCSLYEWAEGTNLPPCAYVCPTKALSVNEMGYLEVDRDKCLGIETCGRCLEVCEEQFGSGIYFDPVYKKAMVCDMCGGSPECVEACPEDAIKFYAPRILNGRYWVERPERWAELVYAKLYEWRRKIAED